MVHTVLVVGGNGFVGSAVCRAALARGWHVTSIRSHSPFLNTHSPHPNAIVHREDHIVHPEVMPQLGPQTHPGWQVSWHAASALSPDTYRTVLRGCTAVVHTVGTLLETAQYKEAIRAGDVGGLVRNVVGALVGGSNPLARGASPHPASYETLNRDAALRVCETYLSVIADAPSDFAPEHRPYAFVYLSAEDMGRPVIPRRYIETKREAERAIDELCRGADVRGVFIRPSFIYHPHLRPFTTPLAALASLSATIHENAPGFVPTPSRVLRALSSEPQSPAQLPSPLQAMATTLELPPIHVDHVGEAICKSIESPGVSGPVGLRDMRQLIGWGESKTA